LVLMSEAEVIRVRHVTLRPAALEDEPAILD
jgi:hypothetical protein